MADPGVMISGWLRRPWSRRPGAEYGTGFLRRGGGEPAVREAAYAEPRLRALFPFTSHGALTFHRNTEFPWSDDLPFIVGDGQACTVWAPARVEARPGGVAHPA
ncbi:DUF6193 family natural product biosynthesis protein [Streptomyces rubiginosohelvolus]|uniref:DUF6193 family natural product biosynthesis protein n=1 Tax=Streptomyces rubiginosohelvolus TaxID=67362 RepID=UPI0035DE0EFE